jgi:hypothetical protein
MRFVLLTALAGVCFGGSESAVTLDSLRHVESSIDDKLRSDINDPYDLMSPARGTYLAGYGAVFTVEMNVITIPQLMVSPFSPKPTEAALLKLHDKKVRKLASLKGAMQDLMVSACQSLPGLAPDDHVAMEAFLFNWSWEVVTGVPHRITIIANKQKLLDAVNRHAAHAEIAALFEERDL